MFLCCSKLVSSRKFLLQKQFLVPQGKPEVTFAFVKLHGSSAVQTSFTQPVYCIKTENECWEMNRAPNAQLTFYFSNASTTEGPLPCTVEPKVTAQVTAQGIGSVPPSYSKKHKGLGKFFWKVISWIELHIRYFSSLCPHADALNKPIKFSKTQLHHLLKAKAEVWEEKRDKTSTFLTVPCFIAVHQSRLILSVTNIKYWWWVIFTLLTFPP